MNHSSRHHQKQRSWLHVVADEPTYCVMSTSRGDVEAVASPYEGFNLCHYTGDDSRHVARCRRMLAEALGIGEERIVVPRQIHSAKVAVIDSIPVQESLTEGVDAVVTKLNKVVVGVSTADCVPVVIVDAAAGIAAALHAGWRGAVGGIVGNTLQAMIRMGAAPADMRAYIGPAICADCFEVGEEVAAQFPESCVRRFSDGRRPHVDLPAYVRFSLRSGGVKEESIEPFSQECCTRCHPLRYFSARASGVESGRNFMFAMLK